MQPKRNYDPPRVMIVEAAAPEESITILLCLNTEQVDEAIKIAERAGLEIWAAESYEGSCQFVDFKEAYQDL